jgi:DNA-binding response OmpR family regulator
VPRPVQTPQPAPPRALLVDDSEIALRFLETRLQRWGLQIDTAADSSAALDLLARHNYVLVFLDVELGENSELDGLALCQQIKQSAAAVDAAVVLVSAHHSELDRVRGSLAGCDAYLGKPLDEIELRRVLMRQGLKAPAREGATPS